VTVTCCSSSRTQDDERREDVEKHRDSSSPIGTLDRARVEELRKALRERNN